MNTQFIEIEEVPAEYAGKVKQTLRFKTGKFVWRVRFNIPLDPDSVNQNSMFVSNLTGQRVKSAIRYDAQLNQIEVEPLEAYVQDQYYYLNVTTNVKSRGGQKLKKPIQLKFKL